MSGEEADGAGCSGSELGIVGTCGFRSTGDGGGGTEMEGRGSGVRCPVRAGGGEGTSCLGLSWAPATARLLPLSGPAVGELRVGTPCGQRAQIPSNLLAQGGVCSTLPKTHCHLQCCFTCASLAPGVCRQDTGPRP